MATLFKRLNHFYLVNKKSPLEPEKVKLLGKKIAQHYFSIKSPETKFHHLTFTTESGVFKVATYPRSFIPTMDILIMEFYNEMSTKRKRIRIPIKEKK